ncbi:glycosyltransferase [Archaeoglobus sp.]
MKTVVISTYRDAGYIEENVKMLSKRGFEIVITVDDPDEKILNIIQTYRVKASISKERRGKWRALNDALRLASGDQIIFLDSDTVIADLSGLNGCDVVEIVKEVRGETIVEKLVNIDYLVMSLGSKIASKFGSCLGINGSAFVIKKSVIEKLGGFRKRINEDTDLGVRVGLNGFKFAICGRAYTKGPKNFKEWFRQRERWSMGGAEVLVENFLPIILKPKLWIPYLIFFYPAIFGLLVSLMLPESYLFKILYLILPLIAVVSPKLASIAILAVYEIESIRNILAAVISFSAWSALIIAFSKKINYRVEYRLLPVYYFLYSPLWTIVCFISFLRVLLCKIMGKEIEVNGWKI